MRYIRWIHEITVFGIISQTTSLFFLSVVEIIKKGIMIAKMLSILVYILYFLSAVVWSSEIRVSTNKYSHKSKEF